MCLENEVLVLQPPQSFTCQRASFLKQLDHSQHHTLFCVILVLYCQSRFSSLFEVMTCLKGNPQCPMHCSSFAFARSGFWRNPTANTDDYNKTCFLQRDIFMESLSHISSNYEVFAMTIFWPAIRPFPRNAFFP